MVKLYHIYGQLVHFFLFVLFSLVLFRLSHSIRSGSLKLLINYDLSWTIKYRYWSIYMNDCYENKKKTIMVNDLYSIMITSSWPYIFLLLFLFNSFFWHMVQWDDYIGTFFLLSFMFDKILLPFFSFSSSPFYIYYYIRR